MLNAKIKQFITKKQILAVIALGLLIIVSRSYPISAQAVSRGYNTDDSLQTGMLVMLKKGDSTKVSALSPDSPGDMNGVVVNPNDTPVTLTDGSQKVFVATTGPYSVLVSDQNGPIKTGDFVTISSISGIGMKAGTVQPLVLGKATSDFDGKNNLLGTTKLKDKLGKETNVNFGKITVEISISRNPLLRVEANVPSTLRKASAAVAQKDVTANRIYLGMVMILVTSIIAAVVLYAGVRSSVTALGRNPLSRKSILRGLFQVVVTSIIIFLCGLFGVYLLLKL